MGKIDITNLNLSEIKKQMKMLREDYNEVHIKSMGVSNDDKYSKTKYIRKRYIVFTDKK